MMSEWKETELGEVADVQTGPFGSQLKNEQYITGGTPVVTVEHIRDFRIIDFDYPSITDEDKDRLSKYLMEEGDILFTRVGSVDLSAYVSKGQDGWIFSSRMLRVRPNKEINSRFLSYFFQQKSFRDYIINIAVGATMPSINTGILETIPISYPPSDEQRAIASVLSSLDDKIDLLNRQNQTLEQMAETIFRKWFVENPNPEWEEKPLSEFGQIICGKTPSKKKSEYFDGEYPFIKIPDMHGKTFVFDTQDSLSEEGFLSQKNKALPPKSINVSCIATVGLVTMNAFPSQTNQQINSIIPTDEYRYYLFCEMKNSYDLLHAMASGGTATLNLNTGNFSKIPVLQPDSDTIDKFNEFVSPMFDKVFENQTQIRTLTALRDTLLPKLMSGEVSLSNFE